MMKAFSFLLYFTVNFLSILSCSSYQAKGGKSKNQNHNTERQLYNTPKSPSQPPTSGKAEK